MIDAAHDEWLTEGVMPRRVVAWLIDTIIVGLLVAVLHLALLTVGIVTLGLGLPLLGLLPLVPVVYVVGFIVLGRGATPGQKATGLVLRRNDDLTPPTGLQALVWTIGLFVTIAAGAFWVLVALVTVRHRTLHDLAAGLVVTRARSLAPRTGIWTMPAAGPAGGSGRPFA
jgi:uncharacterized RDD family membrane protein YckC